MQEESFWLTKIIMSLSGLFGALGISVFWKPKALKGHTQIQTAVIMGGLGVGAAFSLGGFAMQKMGMTATQIDNAAAVGFLVGITATGLMNFIGNFFEQREDKDIIDVVKEVKGGKNAK